MNPGSSTTWPEGEWLAFLAGYQAGVTWGIDHGRAQANQEWTDVTAFACRTALRGDLLTPAERQQRRRESRGRLGRGPQTPQEIRERAARSWAAIAPFDHLAPQRRPAA